MKTIIEQIEKIRKINSNHQLVIFVGAGVSKNSGVCSWWELVKDIAKKIGYSKCNGCNYKEIDISKSVSECIKVDTCPLKYEYSTEEFLLIPQNFYDTVTTKDLYNKFLSDRFCKEFTSNVINEIIVSLEPQHIITTNYDHLLENVKCPNICNYSVIKNDNEMLNYKQANHYIIKMHGDIDDLNSIVLKEKDYLDYSKNHEAIENYLKALLIDKIFMFVGYSLKDGNWKNLMNYINGLVEDNKSSDRVPHYLVTDKIDNLQDDAYWKSKGVELVDLRQISDYMIAQSSCLLPDSIGKQLYTLLYYIMNENLPYTANTTEHLNNILVKASENVSCFNFVSYKTLLTACHFNKAYGLKAPLLSFIDESEYEQFKSVTQNDDIKTLFMKAGIYGTQINSGVKHEQHIFSIKGQEPEQSEVLFELSIQNKYTEIIDLLKESSDTSEKAYYYSLINYTNGLKEIMDLVKEYVNSVDYLNLNNRQRFDLVVYEFNNTCFLNLAFQNGNSEYFKRLNVLLDNAVVQYSDAYKTIKDITDKNADIQEMNNILFKHEEYYMKKSTMSKMGGTIHGELYSIQQIVYDYYMFYKKNHLMLDWFNNVEKMVTPYVKAILCTYYPDEYQYKANSTFGRTHVEQYPLTLIDIDMIVKHIKYKDLKSWIAYYKVFSIKFDKQIDIATLFENFCISMKKFWNVHLIDQLETFGLLLSLSEITIEQNNRIVEAFITLSTPTETENIRALTNNIFSIYTFVKCHYDKEIMSYAKLIKLLIDDRIIYELTAHPNAYPDLLGILSESSTKEAYDKCSENVRKNLEHRHKCFLVYVYHSILLRYQEREWKTWILEHIQDNWTEEIFVYLKDEVIPYNDQIKQYYIERLKQFDKSDMPGVYAYPNNKTDTINELLILLFLGCFGNVEDISFLEQYSGENDYINFIFHPDTFDYTKITTADTMWCNFLNIDKFRDIILPHKDSFWTEKDEKRIDLGFGTTFENRVAYKYLFN